MNPTNTTPPPPDTGPTKGNLEELFRHHLADAKAPPRGLVWEQLDNALLVRQNETYRRRLLATRWVAAASLLLATVAGADWWARHTPQTEMVATRPATAGAPNRPGLAHPAADGPAFRPANGQPSAPVLLATTDEAPSSPHLADQQGTTAAPTAPPSAATAGGVTARGQALALAARPRPGSAAWATDAAAGQFGIYSAGTPLGAPASSSAGLYMARASRAQPAGAETAGTAALFAFGSDAAGSAAPADGWALLALRPAALPAASPTSLPARVAAVAVAPNVAAAPLRRWQFGASYAAGVFHPNADFSQENAPAAIAYSSSLALRPNTQTLNNRAAAEYRNHLQGGLDQRLALRATRRLGGHWALSTGLELGQHRAQSATSASFLGEQLADYALAPPTPLRTTSFRYRTAGVPVELRYANPVRRGWSAYGRFGAVVSALLNVRSEVVGEPEATKTYSLTAAGSPYRRLLTTLRGGAGAQYRPAAGTWTLSAGPTAELGVLSLNAQPMQDFAHQRRPYSFGLEATVDFGGTVKMP